MRTCVAPTAAHNVVTPAYFAKVALSAIVVLALVDVLFVAAFPRLSRLNTDFSAAYLDRELSLLSGTHPITVPGDSALCGYGVAAHESAVALLARKTRKPWINLSYEGGSPANTYAMLRILQRYGVRPRAVVFNVNLKEFNPDDSAYQRLYPAVEALIWPTLAPAERDRLKAAVGKDIETHLTLGLESIWWMYGMREDLRETLFTPCRCRMRWPRFLPHAILSRLGDSLARAMYANASSQTRRSGSNGCERPSQLRIGRDITVFGIGWFGDDDVGRDADAVDVAASRRHVAGGRNLQCCTIR